MRPCRPRPARLAMPCFPWLRTAGFCSVRLLFSAFREGGADGIEELIVELGDFGRIVAGIVVDQFEYLLPVLLCGPRLEHLRQHEIECADCVEVTDAPPVAVDFRSDCLFVLRLGIGQPFQKIAEFIDAFSGRQVNPVVDGARRCIGSLRRVVVLRHAHFR